MTTMAADRETDKTAPRCGCCGRAMRTGAAGRAGQHAGSVHLRPVRVVGGATLHADAGDTARSSGCVALAAVSGTDTGAGRQSDPDPAERRLGSDLGLLSDLRDGGDRQVRGLPADGHSGCGAALQQPRRVQHAAGEAFVLVPDAGRLWKQFKSEGVAGLGPVEDRSHGLREFVVTDPDGNRIRVGSPTPD